MLPIVKGIFMKYSFLWWMLSEKYKARETRIDMWHLDLNHDQSAMSCKTIGSV